MLIPASKIIVPSLLDSLGIVSGGVVRRPVIKIVAPDYGPVIHPVFRLCGQEITQRPSGLWDSKYALPAGLKDKILDVKDLPLWQPRHFTFRREAVGATDIQNISIDQTGQVPLNLTSSVDAIDRFDLVQVAAKKSLEDAKQLVRDLQTYIFTEDDSEKSYRIIRDNMHIISQDISQSFAQWLEAGEIWWTLATESNSLSQLRREKLFEMIRKLADADAPKTVVAKISLPFGKFNKILGETAATQVKWDVLALLKNIYGSEPGRVTFIDSTGIALVLQGHEYSKSDLEEVLNNMSAWVAHYLQTYLLQHPRHMGIRSTDGGIEVINDQGEWLAVRDLFCGDVFAGVARVHATAQSSTADIEDAIHKADTKARARTDQAKLNAGLAKAGGVQPSRVDDTTPEDDLELGKGSLPDGHIPAENDIYVTLYQIYRQNKRSFASLTLPTRTSGYKEFAASHEGLKQIYAVCEAIEQNTPDADTNADDYFRAISESFIQFLGTDDDSFDYYLEHMPYLVSQFAQKTVEMVSDMPLESLPIHVLMNLGAERRYIRKGLMYTGPDGALTKVREVFHTINDLLKKPKWSGYNILNIQFALVTLAHSLKKLAILVNQDMEKSLDDPRFPGKVKYRAFALKLMRHFRDKPFTLEIIDFDNLGAFLDDARIKVRPLQRHDSSKSALERMSRHAAVALGMDEKEVVYAAPGGDELATAMPATADAVEFTATKRAMMEARYGHIRVAAKRKVWVTTPEGEQLQKWPIYSRADGEVVAIDPMDQQLITDYLHYPNLHTGAHVRIFRVMHGHENGGIMVKDYPVEYLAGYFAATERVGISATHATIAPKRQGESVTQFAARIEMVVGKGLRLIDSAKTVFGKGHTWDMQGSLERGLLSGRFTFNPYHVGYKSLEEELSQLSDLAELEQAFDFEMLLRSAQGYVP